MYLATIDPVKLIREDTPYFDLTSIELGIDHQKVKIICFTRENCIVCGTEEAAEVFRHLGIETIHILDSGTAVGAGSELIVGVGEASKVFTAWKPIQNLIDHTSGIATKTRRFVDAVHAVNPDMAVLTTRKMFPGTKALAVKAIMAGGATPHRLGLSETILIFAQHIDIIGGKESLIAKLPEMKKRCCKKSILIETNDSDDALRYLSAGADGIQMEKRMPEEIDKMARKIRAVFPRAILLAAGGINEENVRQYAATAVNGLVTTSLYTAKPVDVGVRIVETNEETE